MKNILVCIKQVPVSYTHLDVYKRQICASASQHIRYSGELCR